MATTMIWPPPDDETIMMLVWDRIRHAIKDGDEDRYWFELPPHVRDAVRDAINIALRAKMGPEQ